MELTIFRKTLRKISIKNKYLLFIVHLTKTIEPFLAEWIKSHKTIGIISIPYSENINVKSRISQLTNIYTVANYKEIPELIKKLCKKHIDKKIILVEIGGYSASVSKFLENVVLTVEDTNQGYWRFKNNEQQLSYPVVSIARSDLKSLENRLVGQSVVFSVERILRDNFRQGCLTTMNILVISYGQIGRAVCNALRGRFSQIYVYDRNPLQMAQAYLDGFTIVDKIKVLPYVDVIIGASGNRSIEMADVPFLKDKVLLVSGSSRQVEFPYEYLDVYKKSSNNNSLIEEFQIVKGKRFFIAYKGQPINFVDDSAFGDTFELIMAGMLQSISYGLEVNLSNLVYDLPQEYQEEVVKPYLDKKFPHFEKLTIESHKAATAFLINYDFKTKCWRCLMIDHKKIKKTIPIGGHIKKDETPEKAVIREVFEETKIKIKDFWNAEKQRWTNAPKLFSIQIEEIPAFKENSPHIHEDYMYIAYINYKEKNNIKTKEKNKFKWVDVKDAIANPKRHNIPSEAKITFEKIQRINKLPKSTSRTIFI